MKSEGGGLGQKGGAVFFYFLQGKMEKIGESCRSTEGERNNIFFSKKDYNFLLNNLCSVNLTNLWM